MFSFELAPQPPMRCLVEGSPRPCDRCLRLCRYGWLKRFSKVCCCCRLSASKRPWWSGCSPAIRDSVSALDSCPLVWPRDWLPDRRRIRCATALESYPANRAVKITRSRLLFRFWLVWRALALNLPRGPSAYVVKEQLNYRYPNSPEYSVNNYIWFIFNELGGIFGICLL